MDINEKDSFFKVGKEFMLSETYEVLFKNKCFDKIQRVIDEHRFYLGDFFDLACFFRNAIITNIIQNQQEIIINDIKPNKIFLILFRTKSLINVKQKTQDYAERFNVNIADIVVDAYEDDLDDFVILLYKENDENDYNEMRNILYKLLE